MGAPKGHEPYNTKGEGGRPVIYTEEFINKEADELLKWLKDEENKCLFFDEFAYQRDYHRRRLNEFAEINERFSHAFEKAKEWQKFKLAKGALTRDYDSGFTKFIMARVCGPEWRDTKDININSNGPVPPWIEEAEGKSKDLVN